MPLINNKASFKNSRIYPRTATQQSNAVQETATVAGPVELLPNDSARTYATVRNLSTTAGEDVRYQYENATDILTEGFLLKAGEAVDLESPQAVFFQGTTVDVQLNLDIGRG